MNFAQYCILITASILVIITLFNLTKMIGMISKNSNSKFNEQDEELNANLRNLFISVGLLSICSLIFIILVFLG